MKPAKWNATSGEPACCWAATINGHDAAVWPDGTLYRWECAGKTGTAATPKLAKTQATHAANGTRRDYDFQRGRA